MLKCFDDVNSIMLIVMCKQCIVKAFEGFGYVHMYA